jgi:DNA-directed RNA polymerase subunit RPC12/RpoP
MDTIQVLRKHYSLYSNSLDAAAKFFDIEQKMDIDNKWDLWERIAFKEETKADLKIMDKYCKQDVSTTEALFYEVRGHISNIPNYSLFIDPKDNPKQVCPNCGSQHTYKNGRHVTTTRTYQRYGCWTCGTPFRTDTKDKNPRAFS